MKERSNRGRFTWILGFPFSGDGLNVRRKQSISLFVVFFLCSITGCSVARIAYEYADWWIEYRLEKLVDLDSQQEDALQSKLDGYFLWHRPTIIPPAIDALDVLTKAARRGECAATFEKQQELWNKLFEESVKRITPSISSVFLTLSTEQINELREGLERELQELRERLKDPSKRLGKFVNRIDDWVGGLTGYQEELLLTNDKSLPNHDLLRIRCREKWQKDLLEELTTGKSDETVQSILNNWWTMQGCNEEMVHSRQEMRKTWIFRMINLENTLTPKQRDSIEDKLESWRDSLREILYP